MGKKKYEAYRKFIQEDFLARVIGEEKEITLFLTSGVRFEGKIRKAGKFSVMIEDEKGKHLIYKSAISTITEPETEKSEKN